MATTRLKRKDRKNKARANNRIERIKQLLTVPVIKNVDPEELKAQFKSNSGSKSEPAEAEAKEKKATRSKAKTEPNAVAEGIVEEHNQVEDSAKKGDNDIEPETAIGSEDKAE